MSKFKIQSLNVWLFQLGEVQLLSLGCIPPKPHPEFAIFVKCMTLILFVLFHPLQGGGRRQHQLCVHRGGARGRAVREAGAALRAHCGRVVAAHAGMSNFSN